jgi:hypothetical protein
MGRTRSSAAEPRTTVGVYISMTERLLLKAADNSWLQRSIQSMHDSRAQSPTMFRKCYRSSRLIRHPTDTRHECMKQPCSKICSSTFCLRPWRANICMLSQCSVDGFLCKVDTQDAELNLCVVELPSLPSMEARATSIFLSRPLNLVGNRQAAAAMKL